MVFQPGQSGNPGGRRKEKLWQSALERAVARQSKSGKLDTLALDDAAGALLNAALEGDVSALKELGDRLDGKAIQQIEHSGGGLNLTIHDTK